MTEYTEIVTFADAERRGLLDVGMLECWKEAPHRPKLVRKSERFR